MNNEEIVARVQANPKFQELVQKKTGFRRSIYFAAQSLHWNPCRGPRLFRPAMGLGFLHRLHRHDGDITPAIFGLRVLSR